MLGVSGKRGEERQANLAVVRGRGKDQGRPAPHLFVTGLRIERQPDEIPAVGHVAARPHQASRPTARPVAVSPWRLRLVTRRRSSRSRT